MRLPDRDARGTLVRGSLAGRSRATCQLPDGVVALSSVVRASGPFSGAILHAIGEGCVADSIGRVRSTSQTTALPVLTMEGDLFRGAHLAAGVGLEGTRVILETKREINDLRERIRFELESLEG